jgi:YHS domain-containing protein
MSKKTIVFGFVLTVMGACGGSKAPVNNAMQQDDKSAPANVANLKAPGDAVVGDSTTCPVSGETFVVTADSPKVEFEGKTYYTCCPKCVESLKADPKKYLAKS